MLNTYKPEGANFGSQRLRDQSFTRASLERAMATGAILEGIATLCDNDFNLHVDLDGIRGIIPKSEAIYNNDGTEAKDIAIITRVGKPVCFKVIGITDVLGKCTALLSRRQAQIECYNNYISTLNVGDIVNARVTHLESFGAFCDIGCGIIALLSIDSISVSRIVHPKERLHQGMQIRAIIKHIDTANKRIFLSTKELLGTWEENAGEFTQGQTITGIIRSIESYGVFVELAPNLAGLAEVKEGLTISGGRLDESCVGKATAVYIKSIIPEKMKIKLVLIDGYKADPITQDFKYYVDDSVTHMNYWRYSPEGALKVIESIF